MIRKSRMQSLRKTGTLGNDRLQQENENRESEGVENGKEEMDVCEKYIINTIINCHQNKTYQSVQSVRVNR